MKLLRVLWWLVMAFICASGAFAQADLAAMSFALGVCAVIALFSIPAAGQLGYFDAPTDDSNKEKNEK